MFLWSRCNEDCGSTCTVLCSLLCNFLWEKFVLSWELTTPGRKLGRIEWNSNTYMHANGQEFKFRINSFFLKGKGNFIATLITLVTVVWNIYINLILRLKFCWLPFSRASTYSMTRVFIYLNVCRFGLDLMLFIARFLVVWYYYIVDPPYLSHRSKHLIKR